MPRGGLVDDQEPRVGRQPLGDDDLLLVAARHGGGRHVQGVGLDLQPAGPRPGGGVLRGGGEQARAGETAPDDRGDVAGDGAVDDQALVAPVLGDEGDAGTDRGARAPWAHPPSAQGDGAPVVGVDAEDGPGDLAATGSDEAGQADDLARADGEGDVVELAGGGEALHVEDHLADLGRRLGEQLGDLAAHHAGDDLALGGVRDPVGGDVGAVAHHGHLVAEGEHLVEAVRDEDQGPTLVAQAAGHGEEPLDLVAAQGGGRLVHDQQAGVEGDGLGDLDDLLVGDAEAQGLAARVDVDAEPGEDLPGLAAHRGLVEAAVGLDRLAAHEDVLGDRQVGEERRLLVDHRDAGVLGLGRGPEVDVLATEEERSPVAAVHAGDDLDERRLAGAVLAHQGVDRAGLDAQAARAQGHDRTEGLGHVAKLEHSGAAGHDLLLTSIERFQCGDGNAR